jgi:DnaK suppressor protein
MSTEIHRSTDTDRLPVFRRILTDEFEAQTARLTELTADTGDPAEAHTRAALIAATRRTLGQVAAALQRIADGTYGVCEVCGGPIPAERLEALPHARLCVPCQRTH